MGIMAAMAGIQSFLKSVELYLKYLPWILLVIVSTIAFSGIKGCQKEREAKVQLQESATKLLRAEQDKHQEAEILATTRHQKELALSDSNIQALLDSLRIKNRQLNSMKQVNLSKTMTNTVVEYDTLYELLEVGYADLPESFTLKMDKCLTIHGEFTPNGLKVTGDRDIDIFDFNYTKRRNLWGAKWLPRIGKKEIYQTLVTSCGDTVTKNQKILFRE